MLSWFVLCSCVWLSWGAPSSTERCMQIILRPLQFQDGLRLTIAVSRKPTELTLERYEHVSAVNKYCDGSINDVPIRVGLCEQETPCLITANNHDHLRSLLNKAASRHHLKYTCSAGDRRERSKEMCLDVVQYSDSLTLGADIHRIRRDSISKGDERGTEQVLPMNWMVPVLGAVLGTILLSLALLLCVKSSTKNEVKLSQQTGLKIIDGPPPEYLQSRQKSNSVVITEHHNTSNNTMTQEARLKMVQPSSPTSTSDERPISHSPPTIEGDVSRPKKVQNPLPAPPKAAPMQEDEANNDDEEEENPYDLADTDDTKDSVGAKNDEKNEVNVLRPPGSSYAKVSRHSGVPINSSSSYAEVTEMNSSRVAGSGRMRSSTEPVEPIPSVPPPTKSRTLSGNEMSHNIPLPVPPTLMGGTSSSNATTSGNDGLADDEKVYDSLDDENEEMYESVPEDLKEELVGMNQSAAPLPPRSPKSVESPSPTKLPNEKSIPESPTSKRASKKAGKKRNVHPDGEDPHSKPKISLLNRFRSSSTSTNATGRSRKEKRRVEPSLSSPTHTHLSQPIPPPPMDEEEEDDDNDMYDSVDPVQILDIKARSQTLPVPAPGGGGVRTSMLFSPRVAEPLPEVPEDSGSGSKGAMVERERCIENDDPNYDVVSGALAKQLQKGKSQDEDESDEEEDNYDTVKPRGDRGAQTAVSVPPHPPGHSYAKVSGGHNPTPLADNGTLDHDDKGYATVDPNIILRKRAASMTKQKSEDSGKSDKIEPQLDKGKKDIDADDEPPYDKVEKGGDENPDDPPYDRVKQDDDLDEPPYDSVEKDGEIDEPPYDRIGKEEENEGNETEEPPYDKATGIGGDEQVDGPTGPSPGPLTPGYATVTKDNMESPNDTETSQNPSLFTFTTETIDVQDVTYSHVNLAKKRKERQQKQESMELTNSLEANGSPAIEGQELDRVPSSSPPPQVPSPACDLGRELSPLPPSVPKPSVVETPTDTPDTSNTNNGDDEDDDDMDPNYDVVGPCALKSTNEQQSRTQSKDSEEANGSTTTTALNGNGALPMNLGSLKPLVGDDDSHIYDSLDNDEQEQVYDSLEPLSVDSPTYDTLEKALEQS